MAQNFYPASQTMIDSALRLLGVIDPEGGITPTTTMRTNALEILNFMLTSWQADGLQLHVREEGSGTLVASQGSYTIGPSGDINQVRPQNILQAWIRNTTNSIDVPLNIVSQQEYFSLTAKTSESFPNTLYYDRQYKYSSNSGANAKGKIFLWPEPDTTTAAGNTLRFLFTRPIQDFSAVSGADGFDFPQEWYNAIRWGLASQLAPEYRLPLNEQNMILQRAAMEKALAMSWDSENTSLFFAPDERLYYGK